jgi:hypothetical protein
VRRLERLEQGGVLVPIVDRVEAQHGGLQRRRQLLTAADDAGRIGASWNGSPSPSSTTPSPSTTRTCTFVCSAISSLPTPSAGPSRVTSSSESTWPSREASSALSTYPPARSASSYGEAWSRNRLPSTEVASGNTLRSISRRTGRKRSATSRTWEASPTR